jgi:hypothetical protein
MTGGAGAKDEGRSRRKSMAGPRCGWQVGKARQEGVLPFLASPAAAPPVAPAPPPGLSPAPALLLLLVAREGVAQRDRAVEDQRPRPAVGVGAEVAQPLELEAVKSLGPGSISVMSAGGWRGQSQELRLGIGLGIEAGPMYAE